MKSSRSALERPAVSSWRTSRPARLRAAVAKLVFRQTAVLVGVAVIAGGIGAWLLSRYLESLVFATCAMRLRSAAPASWGHGRPVSASRDA